MDIVFLNIQIIQIRRWHCLYFDNFFSSEASGWRIFLGTRISLAIHPSRKAAPLFRLPSKMVLHLCWFPHVGLRPFLPLSLVAVKHASEQTPLRTSLLPSPFVLSPRFLNGETGRTLNGQHIDPEGQGYMRFSVEVKGSWTGMGMKLPVPILPRRRSFLLSLFFCTHMRSSLPLCATESRCGKSRCGNPLMTVLWIFNNKKLYYSNL